MRFLILANPWPFVVSHYAALGRDRDDFVLQSRPRLEIRSVLPHLSIPTLCCVLAILLDMRVNESAAASLLVVMGILAAFFLQLSISVFLRAATWVETQPVPSLMTSQYGALLNDLGASSAYAAFVSIGCCFASLAVAVSECGWNERILSGVLLLAVTHLILTLLIVVRRVFLVTHERVRRAVTGSSDPSSS